MIQLLKISINTKKLHLRFEVTHHVKEIVQEKADYLKNPFILSKTDTPHSFTSC